MNRGTTAAYWLSAALAGPEHVEVPQAHGLQLVQLGEDPGVVLARQLAHRVRRPRCERHVLGGG